MNIESLRDSAYKIFSPIQHSRANRFLKTALSCPEIALLFEKAATTPHVSTNKMGAWKVKFVPNLEFEGMCCYMDREIHICHSLPDGYALSILVFELINAIFSQYHHQIDVRAQKGKIDRETFVLEKEKIEHAGVLIHHKIMKNVIKNFKLDYEFNQNANYLKWDFDRYWHSSLRFTPHADFFRKAFANLTGSKITVPGFKEFVTSSIFLTSRLTLKDLKKIAAISLITGCAVAMIKTFPNDQLIAKAAFFGALAYRCLPQECSNRLFLNYLKGIIFFSQLSIALHLMRWEIIDKDLLHLTKILEKRIFNSAYPFLAGATLGHYCAKKWNF